MIWQAENSQYLKAKRQPDNEIKQANRIEHEKYYS